ncbi:uncharacterized protein K452DRAFT_285407 [Aplosporella prunicola CBS 121167]|uniref:Uncharacterized protein n=1 Tax=Aplosporella prunicola CBS 121167 TaxID=1176127 RepID=A0A6A6BMX1_9PEZI|nr:uncharacterized protein K452DRAFT_285407 [Aplosporella prunicola CBS 121167]KAF2144167.1 hypothetical protein K452DRAFT_285407 [Aplosporella prunicola CBS 121167]
MELNHLSEQTKPGSRHTYLLLPQIVRVVRHETHSCPPSIQHPTTHPTFHPSNTPIFLIIRYAFLQPTTYAPPVRGISDSVSRSEQIARWGRRDDGVT